MDLIVSPQDVGQHIYTLLADHKAVFSAEQRIACAVMYAQSGNLSEVARNTDVSYETLKDWKTLPWWSAVLKECKKKNQDLLDTYITDVIHDSVKKLADRVANGDHVMTRTGEIKRIPVKARDLSQIMSTLYDKRANIRGEIVTLSNSSSVTQSEKLKQLEQKFNDFAAKLKGETYPGEVIKDPYDVD